MLREVSGLHRFVLTLFIAIFVSLGFGSIVGTAWGLWMEPGSILNWVYLLLALAIGDPVGILAGGVLLHEIWKRLSPSYLELNGDQVKFRMWSANRGWFSRTDSLVPLHEPGKVSASAGQGGRDSDTMRFLYHASGWMAHLGWSGSLKKATLTGGRFQACLETQRDLYRKDGPQKP